MTTPKRGPEYDAAEEAKKDAVEDVVLGVDGGGTSTRCVCMLVRPAGYSMELGVVGSASGGSSNSHSVGESEALATLKHVLDEALNEAAKKGFSSLKLRAVCLGIAGLDSAAEQDRVLAWLRSIYPSTVKLLVFNDTVPALATSKLLPPYGCVLIAGTGAIAYGLTKDNRDARVDGWGPLLGDSGSGHWLSAKALQAVMRAFDGRGEETVLTQDILEYLHLDTADQLPGWAYTNTTRSHIAQLAPLVFTCARKGDRVAQQILTDASVELSNIVKTLVRKLSFGGDDGRSYFPLVLVGGVLSTRLEWDLGQMVAELVKETFNGVDIVRPTNPPVYGAAWLARNEVGVEED